MGFVNIWKKQAEKLQNKPKKGGFFEQTLNLCHFLNDNSTGNSGWRMFDSRFLDSHDKILELVSCELGTSYRR